MRICFFGTYEADYDRNRILIDALRANGVEVVTCHAALWEKTRNKIGDLWNPFSFLKLGLLLLSAYTRLIVKYYRVPQHDLMFVGYPGHPDIFLARLLSWIRGVPLVFDVFISLYDTLVEDRQVVRAGTSKSWLLFQLDRWSCRLADLVLLDTDSHIDYFGRQFGLERRKFLRISVGADDRFFYRESNDLRPKGKFTVFHYSKFAPMHGVPYILEAAKKLESESDIEFLIVGVGQIKDEIDRVLSDLKLRNVRRVEWMSPDRLRKSIARAGATLGVFGNTPKAGRVIPNKIYQCMAVGSAIITGDGEGVRELLTDGESVVLCPMGDTDSIVEAILKVKKDPGLRTKLTENSRRVFQEHCTPGQIGATLSGRLARLNKKGRRLIAPGLFRKS